MKTIIVTDKFNCPFFTNGDCKKMTICNIRNKMSCVEINEPQCPLTHYQYQIITKKENK